MMSRRELDYELYNFERKRAGLPPRPLALLPSEAPMSALDAVSVGERARAYIEAEHKEGRYVSATDAVARVTGKR